MTYKNINGINKKYGIIYADPPWIYKDKALSGNRGAGCKYQVQTIEWFQQLPIKDISEDNCILFLWVTMPQIKECFKVIESWGFKYKTCGFVWVKNNKKSNSFFMGMGRWTRANAELCLIATKGKPKRISASVRSIINTPIEYHSKKPDIVRDKIIELCGDLPRIELFARKEIKGWDCFGNEIS